MMKKLLFVAIVILTFGMLFMTCQEGMSPDQVAQEADPPQIETCQPYDPPPIIIDCGRMTGGGSVFFGDDPRVRVTRGFELHCDASLPNNLQINWQGGNKFHLTELTEVTCTEDPTIKQFPPDAPFDTFIASGYGRLNKDDIGYIEFVFVDYGEPGKLDRASIVIENLTTGGIALDVSGLIEVGNIQAHDDKCP
jgi:hypothetical protein